MPTFASITDLINSGLGDKSTPQGFMGSLFDDPEYRRMRAFDTMGSIGAALIKASSPTTGPADFGTVLAQGLAGGAQGMQNGEDRYLRRLMTASQVRKNESEMARDKEWADLLTSPGPTATPNASPAAGMAPNGYQPVLGGFESGNNPKAVNPQSGAAGEFQFLPQTWADVRAKNPDLNLPPDPRQAPPELQAEAERRFRAGNAQTLQTAGLPVTPANLYLAHRTGAQGAQTLLKADPNAPMASIVPANWIAQNPDMQGKTVGQFIAMANERFPGVAQGDAVPAGDGSGNPVQPVQYNPQANRPQSIQDVISTIPEGVRKMIAAMPRKDGMAVVMKYADPGSTAAIDTTTGQVVFVPSTIVGRDPRFQPVEGAKLQIERDKLANDQRRTDSTIMNADVIVGPDGRPMVNETVLNAKKGVSAAQGTDPGSKITVELAQDAIKRNNEWQTAGMKAQSSLNRLGALNTLLDQITTGKFTGSTAQLKATAKAAGIDLEAFGIKDDVGVSQAVTALTNLMALENRDPSGGAGMPGAMSDADRAFLQEAGPSITKDPRGNKILIAIKRGDLQRQADIAKFSREYIKSPEFKTNPAGIDDYVAEKIAGKDYYDANILGGQSVAPPGTIPPPPAGFTVPGSGAAPSIPAPPAGFRMVK